MTEVDWPALREEARATMARAYAPYSHFPVGAAGLAQSEPGGPTRVVRGCNVENAAYGVGLCAECGLVSDLHASGGGRLLAVSVVAADGEPVMPCGRCRQLLYEVGGPQLLLETGHGIVPMSQVLPDAFGPSDLATIKRGTSAEEPDQAETNLATIKRGTSAEEPDQADTNLATIKRGTSAEEPDQTMTPREPR